MHVHTLPANNHAHYFHRHSHFTRQNFQFLLSSYVCFSLYSLLIPFFRAIHLHETRVSHSFSLKRETLSLGCFCSMSSMKVRAHAYMRVYVLYAFALIASVVMCVSHAFRYTRERVCNVCEEVARGCLVWLRVYWLNLRLAVVRRYCNVQCNERLGATVVERWVKRSCQRLNWMQKC